MPIDQPFDRRLRRIRRNRAGTADYLYRRAADELLERLDGVTRPFREALVLGHASQYLAEQLEARGLAVVRAEAGSGAQVQCDEDMLPFADGTFDLVISVGALDSVNDLPGALTLIRRVLRPDGLLLAAIAGAGGLPRLRSAMLAAEEATGSASAPRLHPQIDVRAAGDLLVRAGFVLPVADSETVSVRFSGLPPLIADLRAMAANNLLVARSTISLGRVALAAAIADFAAQADPDGKTAERFEIVYLTGWTQTAKPNT